MASRTLGPVLQEVMISHPNVCVCVCVCALPTSVGTLTNLDMCTVILGWLSHCENILTDQSNASNSSMSLSMANLIGQFFIFPQWEKQFGINCTSGVAYVT